jgi:MoxR-like ATPase
MDATSKSTSRTATKQASQRNAKRTAQAAPSRPAVSAERFAANFEAMAANLDHAIKGKAEVIRLALTALLAEGNVLFEDVPGTGKTLLARAIGHTVGADTGRIQCTPDLLPGDVTGSPVLDRPSGEFVFRPGPVFAHVVLADEVNRATPKTQSALLECMQERTVTVDGTTHQLPAPFFVLSTQNPVELAGTFPLPEAQLDRFLFKLSLGYPSRHAETEVLRGTQRGDPIAALDTVVDTDEVEAMIDWAAGVEVSEAVAAYIVDLVRATREEPAVELGASTRAAQALQRSARVAAAANEREDVLPDDVTPLVGPVLAHRLTLTADAQLRGETVEQVVERITARVKVPMTLRAAE